MNTELFDSILPDHTNSTARTGIKRNIMITDEQIKARAKAIGDRPAFPLGINERDGRDRIYINTGMTYRMWLIGQVISHPNGNTDIVEYILRDLAKAELEAEKEVGNG
jgi:hypothetical protein